MNSDITKTVLSLFNVGKIPTVIPLDFFAPREAASITPPIPPHKRIPLRFPISNPICSDVEFTKSDRISLLPQTAIFLDDDLFKIISTVIN